MSRKRSSFTWKPGSLYRNVNNFNPRANKAITAAFQYQSLRSENWMRKNAPWKDDTSNARNGLFALAISNVRQGGSKSEHLLILSHSVPYGIWLEVRFNGKYGVIVDAWTRGSAELWALLSRLFDRMPKEGK